MNKGGRRECRSKKPSAFGGGLFVYGKK